MPFFIVTMTHPDGDGWGQHLAAHIAYLKALVSSGALKASGPLKGTSLRSGFLIFAARGRDEVTALVDRDPFAVHGLIESLEVTEWDPLFGAFAQESSGTINGMALAEA